MEHLVHLPLLILICLDFKYLIYIYSIFCLLISSFIVFLWIQSIFTSATLEITYPYLYSFSGQPRIFRKINLSKPKPSFEQSKDLKPFNTNSSCLTYELVVFFLCIYFSNTTRCYFIVFIVNVCLDLSIPLLISMLINGCPISDLLLT